MIFFDIDNTLINYDASEKTAVSRLIREISGKGPTDGQLDYWHEISHDFFQQYLRKELSFEEQGKRRIECLLSYIGIAYDDCAGLFNKYQRLLSDSWTLFSDVIPCLDSIKGERLGIISNGQNKQQRQKLIKTGIIERFETVVLSGECGFAKPDTGIFEYAMRLSNISVDDMIYVGDNYDTDIAPCKRLGVKCILVNRKNKVVHENVIHINSLCEIAGLLNRI